MITAGTTWNSPNLSMQGDTIAITDGHKKLQFSLAEIRKMCLRPSRNGYFSSIVNNLPFMHERIYLLCITTRDQREHTIRIKGHEKQLYVNLISYVRRIIQKDKAVAPFA